MIESSLVSFSSADLLPEPSVIDLDLIPLNGEQVLLEVLSLMVPKGNENSSKIQEDSKEAWLSALRTSSMVTKRAISTPGASCWSTDFFSGLDSEDDVRNAMDSLLYAGLPMPKSPSVQIHENRTNVVAEKKEDCKRLEREERGWWSMRFKQVLREFQRQQQQDVFESVL